MRLKSSANQKTHSKYLLFYYMQVFSIYKEMFFFNIIIIVPSLTLFQESFLLTLGIERRIQETQPYHLCSGVGIYIAYFCCLQLFLCRYLSVGSHPETFPHSVLKTLDKISGRFLQSLVSSVDASLIPTMLSLLAFLYRFYHLNNVLYCMGGLMSVLASVSTIYENVLFSYFLLVLHSVTSNRKLSQRNRLVFPLESFRTSLVVQRLRIHLPVQGTEVQSLV